MDISNLIALFALIVSSGGIYLSYKNHRTTKEWEFYKENIRQKEQDEQNFYSKNKSRISLIPYFHLSFNKEIYVKNINNEACLILPISLINLGKESATNVQLVQMTKSESTNCYFKTDGLQQNIHFLYDYLDKQYAFIDDTINFSVRCNKHSKAYNVFFKIRYNDLAGRTYEQEFRFQYCFKIMNEFSMNHTSDLPICIEDIDKTNSPIQL
ncbi:hypothetical protein [Bacillus sp. FSL K6-3431]|uniref:hypothetical protein n=1 Tax=Bacillus sp. FSL K6-3431 TaxID=2921500 RepID=UPI0030FC5EC4